MVRSDLPERHGIAAFETSEALFAEPLDSMVTRRPMRIRPTLLSRPWTTDSMSSAKNHCAARLRRSADPGRTRSRQAERPGRYMKPSIPPSQPFRNPCSNGPVRAVNVDVIGSDPRHMLRTRSDRRRVDRT